MNQRLIDKHAVSIISAQRMVCLSAESSSEIAAMDLLSRIFDRKLLHIVLPQSANSSHELTLVFVGGLSINIYWYESDGLRFNFYFLPEDWQKMKDEIK